MSLPELPNNIDKRRNLRDINGQIQIFTVLDEIKQHQSDHREKAIFLQKIRHESNGHIEVRLGYYIIGKKAGMAGKWVWGQYATMIPIRDYVEIFAKAKAKGWFND